jgi:hypothetical protein
LGIFLGKLAVSVERRGEEKTAEMRFAVLHFWVSAAAAFLTVVVTGL